MPRTKGGRSSKQSYPPIIQDRTGLGQKIATTIIGEFITPLEERVEIIETTLGVLGELTRGVVYELDVPLKRGLRGGTAIVELPLPAEDDAIGRPVLCNQAPRGDSDEGGIVLFTGDVADKRHLRLRWFCAFPAPASLKVVYLIG